MMIVALLTFLTAMPIAIPCGDPEKLLIAANSDFNVTAVSEDVRSVQEKCGKSGFCSPWVYCDHGKCECGEAPNQILQCDVGQNLSLLDNNCLTYNEESHLTEVGRCIYTSINGVTPYTVLPRSLPELDNRLCGTFNRTGVLCSRCKNGHYPMVYSLDVNCIQCPKMKVNWLKYILVAYLPLTIFYVTVLVFKINVATSSLYPFVIYAQAVSLPINGRVVLMVLMNQQTAQTVTRWIVML
jgi:hypothetical protein